MSEIAVSAGDSRVVQAPFQVDLEAWKLWLTERVADEWRPHEWNPKTWLFNGDPGSVHTAMWKCATVKCELGVHSKDGLCKQCATALKASGMAKPEFTASYVPRLQKSPGIRERCLVTGDQGACQRDSSSLGMCPPHWAAWRRHKEGEDAVSLEVWARTMAVPRPAFPLCLVAGCTLQRTRMSELLCAHHRERYRRHCKGATAPVTLQKWAEWETPWLTQFDFSLAPLAPLVRLEALYAIRERDRHRTRLDPKAVRKAVRRWAGLDSLALSPLPRIQSPDTNEEFFIAESETWLRAGFDKFRGVDPSHDGELNLLTAGLASSHSKSGRRTRGGVVSLAGLQQPWLRTLLLSWVRMTSPDSLDLRRTLLSCEFASAGLALRSGGGTDVTQLGTLDMDSVIAAFVDAQMKNGTVYSYKSRAEMRRGFLDLLSFGRSEGLLDDLNPRFAAHSGHRIPFVVEEEEDEAGKAIPEPVIRQLDANLGELGRGINCGGLAPGDVMLMMQTAYIICRDTGRRPREFCGLALDCLKYEKGEYNLRWDNKKGKRLRRLLPIEERTAQAILTWKKRRVKLDVPPSNARYLFPVMNEETKLGHMKSGEFSNAMRAWVDAIPAIDSDAPGDDGKPLPFDREKIYPYAFRSSYAQRHADVGTPIDVLMSLMDHKSAQTTMGYYRVTIKRKREAVETLRGHTVDRSGRPAPLSSGISYEKKSVAVPFGGCVEPSNVTAGGKKCPIRFQCAGCGFYRPDPSYLPAIEDHVRSLKADREMATAMGTDDFVVRNLTDQIEAFQGVVERMNERMAQYPPEVQAEIQEASKVLRKVRAGEGRKLLPLTVVNKAEAG
ncbi:Phage integrase family protein [Streptomyces sp. 2323.1]|uniref:tyrosine-type recombinase/integrase n=1 Tax=Streptomyces sp. 2323.1 TaxID=1938841 RepID=UPI000BBFCD1D|nr:site-specific integrase [Streptomyces sp. 2323.1]SOE12147.1 Phage integrase family protein [Streptomyces sp. 2323.1]